MGHNYPVSNYNKMANLTPWQASVEKYVKTCTCDRTIVWICDPEGGHEKSTFFKYMDSHHDTPTIKWSNHKQVHNKISKNQNRIAYFLDLTGFQPKKFNELLYSLEAIRYGHFSFIYDGKCEFVLMRSPVLVVYSNHMPEMEDMTEK